MMWFVTTLAVGLEWGDKKSICNKFLQHSPITVGRSLWPRDHME